MKTSSVHTLVPLVCLLMFVLAGRAPGQVLTFEGGGNATPVGNLYNGGAGGNLGITFSPNALTAIDFDAGGTAQFANEPSPSTVLSFLAGPAATMNVAAGFTTGFSFYYSTTLAASVSVYDAFGGAGGGGNILATLALAVTGPGPGDPTGGTYGTWVPIGVNFAGTAFSVDFGGTANFVGFDDITLFSATPGVVAGPPTVFAASPTSSPRSFLLTDVGAIGSALFSSVPTALGQRELALGGSKTTLRDFNGRLFRHRAGAGKTEDRTSVGEGDGREEETVIIGEGDGKEVAGGGKGTKVVMSKTNPEALRWEVFTSFDYGNLDMDADRNFLGLQSDTYAETLGIEYLITDHIVLGGGVAYLYSDADLGTDVDGVTMAGYISGTWGGLYADLLYGATLLDHDIDRATGLGSTAHASPDSVTHAINLNTGYNFMYGNLSTGPFAGLDYAHATIDGYTESGGGTAATRISKQSVDSLITRLGWQASYRITTNWGAITPQVRVGWERENQDSDDGVRVSLLQSPYYLVTGNTIRSLGWSFNVTVPGYDRQKDYLTAGAGVLVEIGRRTTMLLDYEGYYFDQGYAAHFGKVSLNWKF
ncbi:MAG: autotransporter outer membrane beta-barrel domain-containing protein [Roseimicrobium sp.]